MSSMTFMSKWKNISSNARVWIPLKSKLWNQKKPWLSEMIKILTVLYEFCFRLNFTKDPTTNTIAGATLRQLTPVVMERVSICDEQVRFDHLGFWLNKYHRICNSQLLFYNLESLFTWLLKLWFLNISRPVNFACNIATRNRRRPSQI